MNPGRFISEHRPLVILVALVSASFFSLVSGGDASFIHRGLSRAVNLTSYPVLKVRQGAMHLFRRAYTFAVEQDRLYRENKMMQREIATLRAHAASLAELQEENERLRKTLIFQREKPQITFLPVTVLESYRGMLRIDRGKVGGIQPSMGVITPRGVVGVVTEVADFSANVATLHHMDCRVGAMVLRNRLRAYDGVVHAVGSDFSHLCAMEYIDMTEDVRIGDAVVTSPESQFPAGLLIGRITAVRSSGGLWKSAEIEPAVDPYRLDEVLVIVQAVEDAIYMAGPPVALQQEEGLSGSAPYSPSRAPGVPDMRTLQEKYAP